MVKLVFLWTDILLWMMFGLVCLSVIITLRKPMSRETWRQVFRRPVAMASFIILSCYISVALLDSIHFRRALSDINPQTQNNEIHYSTKVESILEVFLAPIKESSEKTYSSPFAAYAWSKESIEHKDGRATREYPRLEYGGAHLQNPELELPYDLFKRIAWGVFVATMIFLAFTLVALIIASAKTSLPIKKSWETLVRGQTVLPWRCALTTCFSIILIISIFSHLAPYYHIFGTDQVGKDVLYTSLKSIRTGIAIGLITTLVLLPLSIVLGICSGFFGGLVDDTIQYFYITLNSIPGVLLIVASVMMLDVYISNNSQAYNTAASRADIKLLALCCVLGMTSWTSLCRLLRAETLKMRELDYVQAARAFGVKTSKILARHILPNLFHLILITLVIDFSGLVLAEAVLSYIGVGVDPSMESWGNMINSARLELARVPTVWWPLCSAFVFMSTLVLAANLFSDVVREALDPRTREGA